MAGLLLVLGAALAVILFVGLQVQKSQETASAMVPSEGAVLSGKWKEGVIEYQGKSYKYNTAMETYLFLVIDKEGEVEAVSEGIDGGQSDAIFLIAINNDTQEISVIGIHHNTMTEVDRYSTEGKYLETLVMQICLQHGYGDGADISCSRSVKAVSNLFNELPIAGYLSLNMGGIRILNDCVGGVSLEILESISSGDVSLKKGDHVTLNSDEAYSYVQHRNLDAVDSASMRLERQMQYIVALFAQARAYMNGSVFKAVDIFESAESYICTNIAYNKLADWFMHYSFDEANMYSLKGRTVKEAQWEEFYADEDALNELILKVFYTAIR